jgi:enoyl-CoA hydratase/carnithine racemase
MVCAGNQYEINGMRRMSDPVGKRINEGILLRQDHGSVALLTLNRPEARNALSEELLSALQYQIDDISPSPLIRAIIIAANGPVFSSGHDIRQLESHRSDADGGEAYFEATFSQCSDLMKSIVGCPKPVIAAVEGTATAAGCQLVATCDLAVASTDASFCTPGVHIGLFCSTPAVAIARNVGRKRAMEMLLLGNMIPAEQAREFGLINRVVAKEQVRDEAMEMAKTIASKSRPVLSMGKQTFYDQFDPDLAASYDRASRTMVENMMLEDAREGLGAFLNKRTPQWRDA